MDTQRRVIIAAFADLATELTAEDRAALAEALRRPPPGKAPSK
jgi:hypothetical protein